MVSSVKTSTGKAKKGPVSVRLDSGSLGALRLVSQDHTVIKDRLS